jgi:pentatricopeptide repeat protein
MLKTLEVMKDVVNGKNPTSPPFFPSVRDCNTALATFGDGGDFLRALRLFVKMRKASSLAKQCRTQHLMVWNVPAPTLVTYSTLMSRAVHVGRPRVALRLWNLMKLQGEFFSNPKLSNAAVVLVPDVKAANILMNAHAKLANVEEAHDLYRQMMFGNGTDVPAMTPNLVTYNTLLDACHKAGELDAALEAKILLDQSGIIADARTYTNLIATVARKASQTSGANDPSLAFSFLNEMESRNIRPNGMTYSALIDVCGRCRRPDLALQGLRIMLRQKASENNTSLPNEVGAWTAAINAAGKSGRIGTARQLFWKMSNFGVQPNAITCGCLTDCLLRNGRTAETLDVLRHMKRNGIVPSEVMYTSLMTHAGSLVQIENKKPLLKDTTVDGKAIEVYTELITSLMQGNQAKKHIDSNALLVKVFLVFQEMKEVGATPDLACYNALLRACARAGDVHKAHDVLKRIRQDGLHPNDTSWRELIRAAGKARRSDLAEATWIMAVQYRGDDDQPIMWRPSVESFGALVLAYLRDDSDDDEKEKMYQKVITMYKDVLLQKEDRRLHLVGREALHENAQSMLLVLQAIVGLADLTPGKKMPQILRDLATSIVQLDCFTADGAPSPHLLRDNRAATRALQISRSWLAQTTNNTNVPI